MRRKLIGELRDLPVGVYILALLTAIGLGVGVYRLVVGLGPSTNLNQSYPWGLWIGFDLFLVAFSGGAFTLAAVVYIPQLHEFHPAIRPTVLAGLLGYFSVLLVLAMDLGRWDRFYHFIIYPNVNSALFEVSWCILLYSLVLMGEFSPIVLQRYHLHRALAFVKKITVPLVITGVTLSTLHQSSLGSLFVIMARRLHALWYSPIMPILFYISSLAAGLAMVIGGATISYWVFKRSLSRYLVGNLGWFVPWILGIYLTVKLGELLSAGELGLLFTSGAYSLLFLGELLVGVVLPIILFSIRRVRESRTGALVGALAVLLGVFMNRFSATWWAMEPVSGLTYTPHWMEVAVQIGVLSGAALVYSLVGRYLPLYEGTVQVSDQEAGDMSEPSRQLA